MSTPWYTIYEKLLAPHRLTKTSKERTLIEEAQSDHARIIYSSPFRRLQQKAQVFSLEQNAAVRSRLTHTLEVAHIGRRIADQIVKSKFNQDAKEFELATLFVRTVENACLLHDIGNPPFGHFGESAIQTWFRDNWLELLQKNRLLTGQSPQDLKGQYKEYFNDFFHFDGNPQGIRIAISLQEKPEGYNKTKGHGFNLTLAQILSFLKYKYSSSDFLKNKASKPGYFDCEAEKINLIRKTIGFEERYPLVYLMEAADDISYCLSDIEDGIEKNILSPSGFFDELIRELKEQDGPLYELVDKFKLSHMKTKEDFYNFKIAATNDFIDYVKRSYIERHDEILKGDVKELLNEDSKEGSLLEVIKSVSRRKLYSSWEAEKNELAGYEIIYGLLNSFSKLLVLPHDTFDKILRFQAGENISIKELKADLERRLFNRLSEKYLGLYSCEVGKLNKEDPFFEIKELNLRCHLITDYISGMTDNYALDMYKSLKGINL